MRATTSVKENALRSSYLMTNRIAKPKKPFTVGEELIFPSTNVICHEIPGEAAVQEIRHVPMSASTVTRRIEEIAEDINAQLLQRISTLPWCAHEVDESTDILDMAILPVYVRCLHQEDVHDDMSLHYLFKRTPLEQKCSSHWMVIYPDNCNGLFVLVCVKTELLP